MPAKKLYEVVKASPSSSVLVELDLKNSRVTISAGTYIVALQGLDASDFPQVPVEPGEGLQLDAAALLQLIGHVDYAQSTDEQKYNLCGTFFKVQSCDDDWRLYAVATDGHRLAADSIPLSGDVRSIPASLAKGLIVSRKGIAELKKLSRKGILCLDISGNHLTVATETDKLTMRLVDGDFPDYQKIYPTTTGSVEVKRTPLRDSLERVSLFSPDKQRGVSLYFSEGEISFSAQHAEYGDATDRLAAGVECAPCTRRFSSGYLDQALSVWDSNFVEIKLGDELAPVLITPLGMQEPYAVIMPMRL